MKTNITKGLFLTLVAAISLASCKKDKKDNPPPTPPTVQAITITDLKALGTSASVTVPDNRKIGGTVISDVSNKNIDSKTVVLQQATGQPGIVITFDAAQTFALGDSLEVVVSKQTLAQVNDEAVLQNVPAANAKKVGTGNVTARTTNAAAVKQNAAAWDGTLVTIPATGFDGGNGKYTGTLTVTDATGTLNSDIVAGAVFENTAYPASLASLTGIVRVNGNAISIEIRKPADALLGAISRVITESFQNVIDLNSGQAAQTGVKLAHGISTTVGQWSFLAGAAIAPLYLFPGSQFDAGFTNSNTTYLYMAQGSSGTVGSNTVVQSSSMALISNRNGSANLAGLKQISVTFAGSNMSGTGVLNIGLNGATQLQNVSPFNSATDYLQIAIDGAWEETTTGLNITSNKYTSTGQFQTFTFTIPTKDQLVAAGVSSAHADAWLANPTIHITNLSNRAADPLTGNSRSGVYAPIIIEKVVFGF